MLIDLVVRCLSGLHDNSMFVSQAASSFLCSWLHFSGGLQCVADCTLRVSTLQTKVFHIIDHFRSFFKSSSLQHDIIRSVFILAKEFMEMSTQTSGLFIVSIDLLRLTDVAIKNGDRNVCVSVVEFLSKLVRVGRSGVLLFFIMWNRLSACNYAENWNCVGVIYLTQPVTL